MSTTVKLSRNDKERLERLQALITLKAGQKLSQNEILSRLIDEALERGEEFVLQFSEAKLPISDAEYEKILSLTEDWGIETSWQQVDQTLYGPMPHKMGKKG